MATTTQPFLPMSMPPAVAPPPGLPVLHPIRIEIQKLEREADKLRDTSGQCLREAEEIDEVTVPRLEQKLREALLIEEFPRSILAAILERFGGCWAEIVQLNSALRGEPFNERYVRWIVQRNHALLCDLRLA